MRFYTGTLRSVPKAGGERERLHSHRGIERNPANLSRIGPKFGKVNQKSDRFANVIPFPYEQKRQVQFRSTFRTCWISAGTHKCISLTKLVTLSQYIRETPFSCRCFFFIFKTSFYILISVNPQTLFLKLYYRCFFLNFFNHKLSPFRREIVKCGFWRKLPLFYHFCGAPTQ